MRNKTNQKGIVHIILILVISVVIVGIVGIVYTSGKATKLNSSSSASSAPVSANVTVEEATTTKLSDEPVELGVDDSVVSSPRFSIIPPAGWEKLPADGNIVVELLSPSKDTVEEGLAFLNVQPNITVFVAEWDFKDLDEAVAVLKEVSANSDYQEISTQKTTRNGEEVYIAESVIDLSSSARQVMEDQLPETLATAGEEVTEEALRKDMAKVLQRAKGKALSYTFYKDGYYINVVGKALDSFWSVRGPQIKASINTFKFLSSI